MKEQGEIKIEEFPTFSPLWLAGYLSRSGCFPEVSGQAIVPLHNDVVVKWHEIFLTFSPRVGRNSRIKSRESRNEKCQNISYFFPLCLIKRSIYLFNDLNI